MKAGVDVLERAERILKGAPGADQEKGGYQVERIEMKRIIPTRDNPRRVRTDTQDFRELVASIKDMGVLVPLLGRPDPTRPGMIDLRAGARRFAAALEAGLTTVPLIVREMDDKTAIKVTVLENKDRVDLTPLEQARGYRAMIEKGYSAGEIASEMGCSETFVLRRAKLGDLAPEWIAAIEDERSNYFTWHAGHMELIARFDVPVQLKIKAHLDKFAMHRSIRVKDLERELEDFTRNLAKAPWDLEDAELFRKAGACSQCPKRSCCRPGLFDTVEETSKAPVLCLDAVCWKKKDRAFLDMKLREVRAEHPNAVTLARGYGPGPRGDFDEHQCEKAKAGQKGAVPAVVVNGPGRGSVTWVKLPKNAPAPKAAMMTVAEARKDLERRRVAAMADRLMDALKAAKKPPKGMKAERLLALFTASRFWQAPKVTKTLRAKGAAVLDQAFAAIRSDLLDNDLDAEVVIALVGELAGADMKALRREIAAAMPEPVAWKGLKAKDVAPVLGEEREDCDSGGNGAEEG